MRRVQKVVGGLAGHMGAKSEMFGILIIIAIQSIFVSKAFTKVEKHFYFG